MRWFRLHARLILLAAILALGGQCVVAFEAAFHRHEDTTTGHKDGCAVCAAVAEKAQTVDPPPAVPTPTFVAFVAEPGHARHAFVAPLTSLSSRGPPSTPAV